MIGWNKAAGILTVFGLTGLLLSPIILKPAVSAPAYGDRTVAIAIAAGPQLRLLSAHQTGSDTVSQPVDRTLVPQTVAAPKNTGTSFESSKQAMLCGHVYRLAFADVGFGCKDGGFTSAKVKQAPSIALAGN